MQGQDCVTALPHPCAGSLTGRRALDGAISPEAPLQGCGGVAGHGASGQEAQSGLAKCEVRGKGEAGEPWLSGSEGSGKPESCPSRGNRPEAFSARPRARPPLQAPSQLPGPALLTAGLRLRSPWGRRRAQPPPPPPAAQQAHQDQGQRQAQQRGGAEEQRGQPQGRLGLRRAPRAHRLLRLQRRPGRRAAAGPHCWGKGRRGRAGGGRKRRRGRGRRGRGRVGGRRGWAREAREGRAGGQGEGKTGSGERHVGTTGPHAGPLLTAPHQTGHRAPSPSWGRGEGGRDHACCSWVPAGLVGGPSLPPPGLPCSPAGGLGRLLPGLGSGVRKRLQATQFRTRGSKHWAWTHCVGAGPSLPLLFLAPLLLLPMLPHTPSTESGFSCLGGGNRAGPPPTVPRPTLLPAGVGPLSPGAPRPCIPHLLFLPEVPPFNRSTITPRRWLGGPVLGSGTVLGCRPGPALGR